MAISRKNWRLYDQFDDGLGGAYERIALFRLVDHYSKRYLVKNILELNATFICGVPAFNSFLLARAGYRVTVMVHSRDYPAALKIWKKAGDSPRVKIVRHDDDLKTPFPNNCFDLVWNHLVIEQYHHPNPANLIKEMKRVSRNLIYASTLNPHGLGYWIHLLTHKLKGKPWDHGSSKYMLTENLEKLFRKEGLEILGSGGIDCPPWLDTGDSQVQGSMTYVKNAFGKWWLWSLLDPEVPQRSLIKLLWWLETNLPRGFKIGNAHHLYLMGRK